MLLTTFEILLIIVTPLLVLYLRGRWPLRIVAACPCGIPVVWYLTYAPIHELSHALGTILVGGTVVDVKLIPRFWEGQFAGAWVRYEGVGRSWPVMTGAHAPAPRRRLDRPTAPAWAMSGVTMRRSAAGPTTTPRPGSAPRRRRGPFPGLAREI